MVAEHSKPIDFIAEVGINHLGDYSLAIEHIDKAIKAGATIVKFQTYLTSSRVNEQSPIYSILKNCELELSRFNDLKAYCEAKGILFASTPFCLDTARYLLDIDCKIIKIASFHLSNLPLLRFIFESDTVDRIIVSTGVSSSSSIERLVRLYRSYTNSRKPDLELLHCISEYPVSNPRHLHLSNIHHLKNKYSLRTGFSDHSIGSLIPALSVAYGAEIIEKHFTIDNSLPGADHSMSANPELFRELVEHCKIANESYGTPRADTFYPNEKSISQFTVFEA